MNKNMPVYSMLAATYPLLLFLLFFITNLTGGMPPLSSDIIIRPYLGGNAMVPLVLAILAVADIFLYYNMFYSKFISDPKNHLVLLVYPEGIAVFGFIIGFLDANPWAALPFFATGFAIYALVFMKIRQLEGA